MKKKLIIGSILIILAVASIPLLFHPVWFTAEENIVCSKYDDGYDIEYLEGLENDESMLKNNDTEKNGFPIKDGRNYRQLWVEFNVYDTSFLKLKSMSVVAKSIDCESPQKQNIMLFTQKKRRFTQSLLKNRNDYFKMEFMCLYCIKEIIYALSESSLYHNFGYIFRGFSPFP